METSINNTVIGNNSTDDLYYDVALLTTCLKTIMLLVMIPTIISSALLVIHVIWKNEQLHTKYYLFVVNLLVGDVAVTGRYGLEVILMMLYLFGLLSEYGLLYMSLSLYHEWPCSMLYNLSCWSSIESSVLVSHIVTGTL